MENSVSNDSRPWYRLQKIELIHSNILLFPHPLLPIKRVKPLWELKSKVCFLIFLKSFMYKL